jgi:hypothetical protein
MTFAPGERAHYFQEVAGPGGTILVSLRFYLTLARRRREAAARGRAR